MSELGAWIKSLKPARAAFGVLAILITASFSVGLAASAWFNVPGRIDDVESTLAEISVRLERHISQDSLATMRIYCVVKLLFEEGDADPLSCDPNVRGGDQ